MEQEENQKQIQTKEEKTKKHTLTRAEKAKRQKEIVRALLEEKDYKWNELLEEATKKYLQTYTDEQNDIADLKGKIGSSFSVMEEKGEVAFDKKTGVCVLVKEQPPKKRGRKKKTEEAVDAVEEAKKAEEMSQEQSERQEKTNEAEVTEKPKKRRVTKEKQKETVVEEKSERVEQTEKSEKKEENASETADKTVVPEKAEKAKEEKKQATVFDLTAVLDRKPQAEKVAKTAFRAVKTEENEEKENGETEEKTRKKNEGEQGENEQVKEALQNEGTAKKEEQKEQTSERNGVKPVQNSSQNSPNGQNNQNARGQQKQEKQKERINGNKNIKSPVDNRNAEERLKGEFLKKLGYLGGEYFEYYSVYLLARYAARNGRRLEALRVSGGGRDGGIDGELELCDKFGFRGTLYIQAKNWNDTSTASEKWQVGETLLQQFIGAVVCRQAMVGKRNCRGVFVTTSHFTDGAKAILSSMNADFAGYDGDDLFEAAKECSFGVIEKDGKLRLDEKLLSGEKAFFELV